MRNVLISSRALWSLGFSNLGLSKLGLSKLGLSKLGLSKLGVVALALTTLALSGCPQVDGDVVEPPVNVSECTKNSNCPSGFICVGGSCDVGECDPTFTAETCAAEGAADDEEIGPYCCRVFQVCGFDRSCRAIEGGPVNNQCEIADDCSDPGDFCSAGTCYAATGRTACTGSFQCPTGERCDRTAFLCVPDQGGCNFCAQVPELCCEDVQNCDVENGFCIDVGEDECTDADLSGCLPGQICSTQRQCVQCITNDDCGPGTACNTGTGSCFSVLNVCEDDDDCSSGKRCAPATSECITPQCEGDAQCQQDDMRALCALSTFTCFLPAATCNENDEPNNGVGSATVLGGFNGAGTLCRGDVDYLSFPVVPNKRYRATVTFPDFTVGGNTVAILNGDGVQEAVDTFASFQTEATVSAITGANETATTYYLRLSGSGSQSDLWSYTIEIEELEAPDVVDCDEEFANGIEPNDNFAESFQLTAPGSYTFARCNQQDADFYKFSVPTQNGIEVTVEFDNTAGDMAARLYNGMSENDDVDYSDGAGTDTESLEAPEGDTDYWLRIALWSTTASGIDGQPYTVTLSPQARPSACDPDLGEPGDDTFLGAQTLAIDTAFDGVRCVSVDNDWYTFTIPANFGGSLALGFVHSEGDLRLDLYDDTGIILLDSSNGSSNNSGVEVIEIPFSGTAQTYLAQLRLHTGTGQVAQAYTLTASTYDASICVASESAPNNVMLDATCVGASLLTDFTCASGPIAAPIVAPAPATCTSTPGTPGCGTTCGVGDEDWYRVGRLNDGQVLRARLRYDPGMMGENGRLGLVLVRANADLTAANFVEYDPNPNTLGDISLALNAVTVNAAFAREYAVVVRPEGTEGFSALPYTLDIDVGDPCVADASEPNEDPSQSTLIRINGAPLTDYDETLNQSLCGFDTDVYEFFGFTGETVTVTLAGPPNLVVNIGERPIDITDEAPTVVGGAGMVVNGPCPIPIPAGLDNGPIDTDGGTADGGGADAGLPDSYSCVQATYTSPGNRQVYLTVKRTAEDVSSIGPYDLRVEVVAP